MKRNVLILSVLATLFAACGDDKKPDAGSPQPGNMGTAPPPAGHGASVDLGMLTVAGREFGIVRLGDLQPGAEVAFEVNPKGSAVAAIATLNVYLWVEGQDGTQLSAPAKGILEGKALHFHLTPRKGDEVPNRVVLRLRAGGTDERASLPLDGHGHEHVEGPHHGIPAAFKGGAVEGFLELKLHDDKGDLELWLTHDDKFQQPLDLPLDASIEIEFVDVGGRKVSLRPRNLTQNEDEDGTPNIRNGMTNYFIFPSQDGEDAGWLQGKEFQSIVVVRFTSAGQSIASEEFVLKPHVH